MIVLENDADWDVNIRESTPQIAKAMADLTGGNSTQYPWGENWDLLAVGHCGAGSVPDDGYRVVFDEHVGPAKEHQALWPANKDLPEHSRFIHKTSGACCAYGYAVNKRGLRKLYELEMQPGHLMDLDIAGWCGRGKLNCFAVTPELFHHQRDTSRKSTSFGGSEERPETAGQIFTVNIKHSARCNSKPGVQPLIQCHPEGNAKGVFHT